MAFVVLSPSAPPSTFSLGLNSLFFFFFFFFSRPPPPPFHAGALVTLYLKLVGKTNVADIRAQYPRLFAIPFQSDYKFMATVQDVSRADTGERKRVVFVKGAPDKLIARCVTQGTAATSLWESAPMQTQYWNDKVEQFSGRGLRVLAICHYELPSDRQNITVEGI